MVPIAPNADLYRDNAALSNLLSNTNMWLNGMVQQQQQQTIASTPGVAIQPAPTDANAAWQQAMQSLAAATAFQVAPPVQPTASTAPTNSGSRKRKADASVVSGSVKDSDSAPAWDTAGPPIHKTEAEIAKLSPAERRRYERNLREQQRSYRISQQIKKLRDVLAESNVPFKPNKFSILVSVVNYIKQLQSRAIMLDAEHQKLVDTIRQAGEMKSVPTDSSDDGNDQQSGDTFMVEGVNFESVFQACPHPMAVASLDGRLLGCNERMEEVFEADEGTLQGQSLFMHIRNHQEVFEAMASLLKRSSLSTEAATPSMPESSVLYWCGGLETLRSAKVCRGMDTGHGCCSH